jgi:plasmid stability protein
MEVHGMAQLFVPALDEAVEACLRARARRNGRSPEAEARPILAEAVAQEQGLAEGAAPGLQSDEKGFGDLMYERFRDIGLRPDEVHFNQGVAEINSLWAMGLPDFEVDAYEEAPSRPGSSSTPMAFPS